MASTSSPDPNRSRDSDPSPQRQQLRIEVPPDDSRDGGIAERGDSTSAAINVDDENLSESLQRRQFIELLNAGSRRASMRTSFDDGQQRRPEVEATGNSIQKSTNEGGVITNRVESPPLKPKISSNPPPVAIAADGKRKPVPDDVTEDYVTGNNIDDLIRQLDSILHPQKRVMATSGLTDASAQRTVTNVRQRLSQVAEQLRDDERRVNHAEQLVNKMRRNVADRNQTLVHLEKGTPRLPHYDPVASIAAGETVGMNGRKVFRVTSKLTSLSSELEAYVGREKRFTNGATSDLRNAEMPIPRKAVTSHRNFDQIDHELNLLHREMREKDGGGGGGSPSLQTAVQRLTDVTKIERADCLRLIDDMQRVVEKRRHKISEQLGADDKQTTTSVVASSWKGTQQLDGTKRRPVASNMFRRLNELGDEVRWLVDVDFERLHRASDNFTQRRQELDDRIRSLALDNRRLEQRARQAESESDCYRKLYGELRIADRTGARRASTIPQSGLVNHVGTPRPARRSSMNGGDAGGKDSSRTVEEDLATRLRLTKPTIPGNQKAVHVKTIRYGGDSELDESTRSFVPPPPTTSKDVPDSHRHKSPAGSPRRDADKARGNTQLRRGSQPAANSSGAAKNNGFTHDKKPTLQSTVADTDGPYHVLKIPQNRGGRGAKGGGPTIVRWCYGEPVKVPTVIVYIKNESPPPIKKQSSDMEENSYYAPA